MAQVHGIVAKGGAGRAGAHLLHEVEVAPPQPLQLVVQPLRDALLPVQLRAHLLHEPRPPPQLAAAAAAQQLSRHAGAAHSRQRRTEHTRQAVVEPSVRRNQFHSNFLAGRRYPEQRPSTANAPRQTVGQLAAHLAASLQISIEPRLFDCAVCPLS